MDDGQDNQSKLNQSTSDQNSENQPVSVNQSSSFNPSGAPTQYSDPGALVTAGSDEGKKGNRKVIATVLGILLLIGAVATGVFLVSSEQEIRIGAWDCRNYVFEVNQDGVVSVRNGSTRDEPAQQAKVYINGTQVTTFDVPALKAGDAATLGNVNVGDFCSFSWEVIGTKDCRNSGGRERSPTLTLNIRSFTWTGPPQLSHATTTFCDGSSSGKIAYNEPGDSSTVNFDKDIQSVVGFGGGCNKTSSQACTQPTPTLGPTPTTPPPTPTPTPPPIGAACHNVKAYDTNWNLFSGFDLSSLEPGDIVRFAVAGTTTAGSFDKARFTINGTLRPEVTAQKPGSDEFYDEYTIPEGTEDFSVSAQIHHSSLGWF